MGFFTRLSDIVSANINDMLDKMEEPDKMMKQLVREMEEAVGKAKDALVKAIAHERLIEKEIAANKKKIEEWQARAEEAIKQDREDLARRALELKHECQDVLAALQPELKAAADASGAMRTQLRAIEAKLQEAKRKQTTLSARQRAAETQKIAAGGTGGKVDTGAFAEFERMQGKVQQAEAEAQAMSEVAGEDKIAEEEFSQWERGKAVDDELAALKSKVKKGG
jgi:phage shock protein A